MNKCIGMILLWCFCVYGEISASHSLEGKVVATEQHSYQLRNYLSRGAFGSVFRATDENGEVVAVKVFERTGGFNSNYFTDSWPMPSRHRTPSNPQGSNSQYSDHPSALPPKEDDHRTNVYTIEREWEIGSAFDHPNIIKAYDRGIIPAEYEDEDSIPFLVLEFVAGVTFFDVTEGEILKDEATALAVQLIDALKYGLSNKMYYCDLHAGNVMLSDDHAIKIIDLGSYRSFQSVLNGPVQIIYWDLQSTYLFIKKILRRGGHSKNEIARIAEQMKNAIKTIKESSLPHMEVYEQALEEWSLILQK